MKFTIEIDSNFDIDVEAFIETMNEAVLSDSYFIMGISSDQAYNDDRVVRVRINDYCENSNEKSN